MGDRTTRYLPCPQCGGNSEQYDAPSSIMWVWSCHDCSWKDDHEYYETDENTTELLTEQEARDRGVVVPCPVCGNDALSLDVKSTGRCFDCTQK